MASIRKRIAVIVGLLFALLVAVVLVVPLLVDPDDYREELAALVERQTGRELRIEGEIGLSIFPWLGVRLGAMTLGNAEGFGPEPFARIEQAEVRVKLLPLLRREVEMDTALLRGLVLNLARDTEGRGNWEGMAGPDEERQRAPEPPPDDRAGGGGLAALAIGGVRITDARISWEDRAGGQQLLIHDLALTSGALAPGEPFALSLRFAVEGERPRISGTISLATTLTLDPEAQRYRAADLRLEGDLTAPQFPGGRLAPRLEGEILADLATQRLTARPLELHLLGLHLSGETEVASLLDAPRAEGRFEMAEFVPRALLERLEVVLPEMADPNTLTKASASFGFSASTSAAALQPLELRLDDSRLEGSVSVTDFTRQALHFDLALDKIDADRYLPPPTGEPAAGTPASAGAAGAAQLPMEPLRALDVAGKVTVGHLKLMNLRSEDIHATLNASEGRIRLHPLGARLYDGDYRGDLRLDVRGDVPVIAMDEVLQGVQAEPLLRDFMGKAPVTGTADVAAKLTARGLEPMAMRETLAGNASFRFADGMVNGVNVAQLIRSAHARITGQPAPPQAPQQTDFAELSGSVTVTQGVARNDDLVGRSPLLRVNGQGRANLVTEEVDYTARVTIVGTLTGQGGEPIEELKGITVPLRITGSFSDPRFGVDAERLLESRTRERAEEAIEKEKERLEQKLEEKAGEKLKEILKF